MSDSARRTIQPLGTITFSPAIVTRIETLQPRDLSKARTDPKYFDPGKFYTVLSALRFLMTNVSDDGTVTQNEHAEMADLWEQIRTMEDLQDTTKAYEMWNFHMYNTVGALSSAPAAAVRNQALVPQ